MASEKTKGVVRTLSMVEVSDCNQDCNSLCKAVTSSTEHFLAATLATFDSSRFTSAFALRWEVRKSSSPVSSTMACTPTTHCLGVDQPLDDAEKSMRIKRMSSLVKCSRQKGQAGASFGEVFWMMLLQQPEQRT